MPTWTRPSRRSTPAPFTSTSPSPGIRRNWNNTLKRGLEFFMVQRERDQLLQREDVRAAQHDDRRPDRQPGLAGRRPEPSHPQLAGGGEDLPGPRARPRWRRRRWTWTACATRISGRSITRTSRGRSRRSTTCSKTSGRASEKPAFAIRRPACNCTKWSRTSIAAAQGGVRRQEDRGARTIFPIRCRR